MVKEELVTTVNIKYVSFLCLPAKSQAFESIIQKPHDQHIKSYWLLFILFDSRIKRLRAGNVIDTAYNTRGGGGTPIWNGRGCSSEILNLTPKGDHLGVAQAFCDP